MHKNCKHKFRQLLTMAVYSPPNKYLNQMSIGLPQQASNLFSSSLSCMNISLLKVRGAKEDPRPSVRNIPLTGLDMDSQCTDDAPTVR